jgi:hypothetical protein
MEKGAAVLIRFPQGDMSTREFSREHRINRLILIIDVKLTREHWKMSQNCWAWIDFVLKMNSVKLNLFDLYYTIIGQLKFTAV